MTSQVEHTLDLGFSRQQLEALSGKSYDTLRTEAKENHAEIERFIHQYEGGSNGLLSFLTHT